MSHRDAIIRKTRLFQGAVVLLVGCAAAGVALPVVKSLLPAETSGHASIPAPPPPPPQPTPLDLGESLKVARDLLKWKEGDKPADATASAAESKPEPPPPPPADDWKFTGSMLSSTSRAAIVKIDDQQHRIREGESVGETTLVAIEPDSITIRTHGVEKKIQLQARAETWPTDGAPARRPPGTPAGAPTLRPGQPVGQIQPPASSPPTFDRKTRPPAGAPRSAAETAAPPSISDEQRNHLVRQLRTPEVAPASKVFMLRQLGITQGMDSNAVSARLRDLGIDPHSDPNLSEAVKLITGVSTTTVGGGAP